MRGFTQRAVPAALLLALPLVLAENVSAQEEAATEPEACTAVLTPSHVTSAATPVQISAALSEDIGFIDFQAPEESGLTVVEPENVPLEEMANEDRDEAPQPIVMAAEANTFLVWLNTENAQAGSYDVVLEGETGKCTTTIQVDGEGASN